MYGTQTPTSDIDIKEVFVPSGESLLMEEAPHGYQLHSREKTRSEKNKPGDIDTAGFSVSKLFRMITEGDILGIEMLFTPDYAILDKTEAWDLIQSNRHEFITSKLSGYVSYCQRQAAKYGIKGSRVGEVLFWLNFFANSKPSETLNDWWDRVAVELSTGNHGHSSLVQHEHKGTGRLEDFFEVCNRKFPRFRSMKDLMSLLNAINDQYGARAKAAATNNGVDWKAMSHAVRVANQAVELLTYGTITFPRPEAEILINIKLGKFPFESISEFLEEKLREVSVAASKTRLPDLPNFSLMRQIVMDLHKGQIHD